MTTDVRQAAAEIARHNELVLDNARRWAAGGYAVRVQVLPHAGERPCRVCKHLIGVYMLNALPATPDAACEREAGCICEYHLVLLV